MSPGWGEQHPIALDNGVLSRQGKDALCFRELFRRGSLKFVSASREAHRAIAQHRDQEEDHGEGCSEKGD
jgi:hypothetical protein